MSHSCPPELPAADGAYRRVLVIALVLNAWMFALELVAGITARSSALLADAADFGGDAASYALSLGVLAFAPALRSRAALVKGLSMGVYGLAVLAHATWSIASGTVPEPAAMGAVGLLALAVNVGVAATLFRYRTGDADMRSVWLCSRNDAIGNASVLVAALLVFVSGSGLPDQAVATMMGVLALSSSVSVVRQARREIKEARCE